MWSATRVRARAKVILYFYINDLCNVSDIVKFILFADDTNIFYSDDNLNVLNDVKSRD